MALKFGRVDSKVKVVGSVEVKGEEVEKGDRRMYEVEGKCLLEWVDKVCEVVKDIEGKSYTRKEIGDKYRDLGENLEICVGEGVDSDKLEFECCLYDPKRRQVRVSGKKEVDSHVVVGYVFRVHTSIELDHYEQVSRVSECDGYYVGTRRYKAGDRVICNILTVGSLLSQERFGGVACGGDLVVYLDLKYSTKRSLPRPVVELYGEGSIKENMVAIADSIINKYGKEEYRVKEEYREVFGDFYEDTKVKDKGEEVISKTVLGSIHSRARVLRACFGARRSGKIE